MYITVTLLLFLAIIGILGLWYLIFNYVMIKKDKTNKRNIFLEYVTDERFFSINVILLTIICFFIIPSIVHIYKNQIPYLSKLKNSNEIGDAFGGTLGPIIGVLGVFLTYLAFYVQYKANLAQSKTWHIERFESKFYELLKIHKSNVDEMNIQNIYNGRETFYWMYYELKQIYREFQLQFDKNKNDLKNFKESDLLTFSYKYYFWGHDFCTKKSTPDEKKLLDYTKNVLENYDAGELVHKPIEKDKLKYITGNGHYQMLDIYYRHLYQLVTFVGEQNENFITFEQKKEYIKTIRAQLSKFEQLMLYYNSLAWFQKEWKDYFIKYKLIKNIPLDLVDFGINPNLLYNTEIKNAKLTGEVIFHEQ